MILNEYQKCALKDAISSYLMYTVPYTSQGLCSADTELADTLCSMAEHNLYSIMCVILETGKPEQTVLKNLDNKIWGIDDVIKYIEETY